MRCFQRREAMKITDVHAHVFPDKLADKAAHSIGDFYGAASYCAASVENLLREEQKAGISRCVSSGCSPTCFPTRRGSSA